MPLASLLLRFSTKSSSTTSRPGVPVCLSAHPLPQHPPVFWQSREPMFLRCPAPMPAHHSPFIAFRPSCPTVVEIFCGARSLEEVLSGYFARIRDPCRLLGQHGTGSGPSSMDMILASIGKSRGRPKEQREGGRGEVACQFSLFSSFREIVYLVLSLYNPGKDLT